MIYKLRHIFVFLFVFSVFSITLQASIINICKDSKAFKSQNQTNPVTEEEEESHESDENADELFYIHNENTNGTSVLENTSSWFHVMFGFSTYTKSIQIPPPKF